MEGELEDARATVVSVASERRGHLSEISALQDMVEQLQANLDQLEADKSTTEQALADAEAQIQELLVKYDEEIRAELQTLWDTEVARACEQAKEQYEEPIGSMVGWTTEMEPIGTRDDLIAEVEECSAEERARTAEERLAEAQALWDTEVARACAQAIEEYDQPISPMVNWTQAMSLIGTSQAMVAAVEDCAAGGRDEQRLAACAVVEPDELEKDPWAYVGDCIQMYARIVQYDANTGPCGFHANISAFRSTYWGDFHVRVAFGYTDDIEDSNTIRSCPDLNGIDNHDYIRIWGMGLGPFRYDTQAGGTNVVPAFKIERVELVQKDS